MKKYSLNKDTNNSLQEVLKTVLQRLGAYAFSTTGFKSVSFDCRQGHLTPGAELEIVKTIEHRLFTVEQLEVIKQREPQSRRLLWGQRDL